MSETDNQLGFSNAYIPSEYRNRIFGIPSHDLPFAVFFGYVTNVRDNGFINVMITPPVDFLGRDYPLFSVMISGSTLKSADVEWYQAGEFPMASIRPNTLQKLDDSSA